MNSNDYYRFDDKRRAFTVFRSDTPQPWINYLSNGTMHAFVSQAGGGFAWWKSPSDYRITRYRQYNLPLDSPGFYVYIRHRDGTIWSPTSRPCSVKPEKWLAEHLPGKIIRERTFPRWTILPAAWLSSTISRHRALFDPTLYALDTITHNLDFSNARMLQWLNLCNFKEKI